MQKIELAKNMRVVIVQEEILAFLINSDYTCDGPSSYVMRVSLQLIVKVKYGDSAISFG